MGSNIRARMQDHTLMQLGALRGEGFGVVDYISYLTRCDRQVLMHILYLNGGEVSSPLMDGFQLRSC